VSAPILVVEDLTAVYPAPAGVWFKRRRPDLLALDRVDFTLDRGATLGVVGESGSGKSTLARALLGLGPAAVSGKVYWRGENLLALAPEARREKRQQLQLVFQDPLGSLNPRLTAGEIIAEPLRTFHPRMARVQIAERVRGMLKLVGLDAEHVNRYPHEFSGGQCQRLGIARALVLNPRLLICDEPVSALDVSIQAQIIHLLKDLQAKMQLTMVFIAHDLGILRQVSDQVLVLYLGRVMEFGDRQSIYQAPRHPYTRALLNAVPWPDPERERRRVREPCGELPSAHELPEGCLFHPRCPFAIDRCRREKPSLRPWRDGRTACHRSEELALGSPTAPPAVAVAAD